MTKRFYDIVSKDGTVVIDTVESRIVAVFERGSDAYRYIAWRNTQESVA